MAPHQAHLATNPPGHLLTNHFLPSSSAKTPNPNAAGKKKYSHGTGLVFNTTCNLGIYNQKKAMSSEKKTAGKRCQFWVCWLKMGGWWKMLRWRVRVARRLNHCITTRMMG